MKRKEKNLPFLNDMMIRLKHHQPCQSIIHAYLKIRKTTQKKLFFSFLRGTLDGLDSFPTYQVTSLLLAKEERRGLVG